MGGIVGSLVFNILLAISIWLNGHWIFGVDFLSDLGAPGPNGWMFNVGVMVLGALGIVFAAGLYQFISWSKIGKLAAVVFGTSCFFLFLVGAFPINTGDLHDNVSWAFFVLVVLSLLLMIVPFWDTNTLGRLSLVGTMVTVFLSIFDLLLVFVGFMRYQLCEELVVLALTVWVVVTSLLMHRKLRTDSFYHGPSHA